MESTVERRFLIPEKNICNYSINKTILSCFFNMKSIEEYKITFYNKGSCLK